VAQKSLIKLSSDRGRYLAIISLRGALRNRRGIFVETTLRANKNIVWRPLLLLLRPARRRSIITVILSAAPIVTNRRRGIHRDSQWITRFRLFLRSLFRRRRVLSATATATMAGEKIANEMFLIKTVADRLRRYNSRLTTASLLSDLQRELPRSSANEVAPMR